MLKKFRAFLSLLLLLAFSFKVTHAADAKPIKSVKLDPCGIADGRDKFGTLCSKSTAGNADLILQNIIVGIMTFAALLALIFLIWGGVKWITSGGDKTKIEAARNTIIAAIVGLVLVLLSYFILSTVLTIFGIDLMGISIPQLQSR